MTKTDIQWADMVLNPTVGCKEQSEGCANCYAKYQAKRLAAMGQKDYEGLTRTLPNGRVVWTGEVRLRPDFVTRPLKRQKPTIYFLNSMSDFFHPAIPNFFRDEMFSVMALAMQHRFIILTKFAENAARYMARLGTSELESAIDQKVFDGWRAVYGDGTWGDRRFPLPNVAVMLSTENQRQFDQRMEYFDDLRPHVAVLGISAEPLLGPINLGPYKKTHKHSRACYDDPGAGHGPPSRICNRLEHYGLDWVIAGGESKQGPAAARACDREWLDMLICECREEGLPVFVKQLGSNTSSDLWPLSGRAGGNIDEWPEELQVRQWPRAWSDLGETAAL